MVYLLTHRDAIDAIAETERAEESYEEAIEAYGSSLELYEEIGERLGQAMVLTAIGRSERALGNQFAARNAYEQAIALRLLARQDTETARRYYGAALELYAKTESGRWQAIARDELDKLGGEDP